MSILTAKEAESIIAKDQLERDRLLPSTTQLPLAAELQLEWSSERCTDYFTLIALVDMLIDRGILKGSEHNILWELQARAEYLQKSAEADMRESLQREAAWEKHRARVRRGRAPSSRL